MNQDRSFILAALILLLAVIGVYSNHFNNGFQFDDSHTICNNIFIRDLHNIPKFFKDATTFSSLPANQSYRPVVSTSLAIDYWLGGGLTPFFFHLSTFLWFLVQGAIMFFLFLKIMDITRPHPWNKWFSLFTVALYMLHTVNAETINYIISRSDSLSTLAIVATMYLYAANGKGRKYFLYLIPLVIGLLTKPTSVMFIGILFFYILLFETDILDKGIDFKNLGGKFLHLGVTMVVGVFGYWFMDKMTPPTWVAGGLSKYHYWITQPYVILHYFKMFFLPNELSADTDWTTLDSMMDYRFFAGITFFIIMATIVVITMRKKTLRPIAFGILWFFIALVPTSLVPLAEVLNDHRMFFPFVGLVLSVGWSLSLLAIQFEKTLTNNALVRGSVLGILLLVLCAFGVGTHERNKVWHDDLSLWQDVAIKSPKNGRGLMNYGLALAGRGNYQEALKVYQQALKLTPYYSYLHINMALTYSFLGQQKEAEDHFKYALQIAPPNQAQEATYFYGYWLSTQGRTTESKYYLRRTLQLSPAYVNARYILMDELQKDHETAELKALCNETLNILPGDAKALQYLSMAGDGKDSKDATAQQEDAALKNPTPEGLLQLSLVYYNQGQYQKTIEICQKAIALKPNFPQAYNNICSSYNMLKQWDKGIEACNKALELDPNFQLAKNNLNWAKSELAKK